jgi:predicted AAA+ superfamily ATPase
MEKLIKLPFINHLDANLRAKLIMLQVLLGPRQVGKTTTILRSLDTDNTLDVGQKT